MQTFLACYVIIDCTFFLKLAIVIPIIKIPRTNSWFSFVDVEVCGAKSVFKRKPINCLRKHELKNVVNLKILWSLTYVQEYVYIYARMKHIWNNVLILLQFFICRHSFCSYSYNFLLFCSSLPHLFL